MSLRSVLLLTTLVACGPSSPSGASDARVSARADTFARVLRVTNLGTEPLTIMAIGSNASTLVDPAPCEIWQALGAGAGVTFPLAAGEKEMLVSYCVFPLPVPAKPTSGGTLRVPIR
jgi:hypothetical protein